MSEGRTGVGRLEGKVILINGAGSGIGAACAAEYARQGAKVVVGSQSRSSEKVAAQIVAEGFDAKPFSADIADEAQVQAMVQFTLDSYGRIDVLHNNAAMTGLFLDFEAGRSKGQYDDQACLPVLRQGLKLDEIHGRIALRAAELAQPAKGRRWG